MKRHFPLSSLVATIIFSLLCVANAHAQTSNTSFSDAGKILLERLPGAGATSISVSVVDERQDDADRAGSEAGFVTSVLIQQVSFAAAALPQYRVVESSFVVQALLEKEKAAQKDIPWDQAKAFGDFEIVQAVLAVDARLTGSSWNLSLRLVDLKTGQNKGSASLAVSAAELTQQIQAQSLARMPALRPALKTGLEQSLGKALARLKKKTGEPVLLATGNFAYQEREVSGPAAQFLGSEIELILADSPLAKLIRLNGGERPSSSAFNILKQRNPTLKFDSVLEGRYYDEGDSVRLYWSLVAYPSGELLSQGSTQFRRSEIPSRIALAPPESAVPSYSIASLTEVPAPAPTSAKIQAFKVELTSDRGNGGRYIEGENLKLYAQSNRDCYIKIYHIDVAGTVNLIFPNAYQKNNFVPAGALLPIPGEKAPFNFQLGAPFGVEQVKLVASTEPFTAIESDFTTGKSLGMGSSAITRGLAVKSTAETTEARLSYVIEKK